MDPIAMSMVSAAEEQPSTNKGKSSSSSSVTASAAVPSQPCEKISGEEKEIMEACCDDDDDKTAARVSAMKAEATACPPPDAASSGFSFLLEQKNEATCRANPNSFRSSDDTIPSTGVAVDISMMNPTTGGVAPLQQQQQQQLASTAASTTARATTATHSAELSAPASSATTTALASFGSKNSVPPPAVMVEGSSGGGGETPLVEQHPKNEDDDAKKNNIPFLVSQQTSKNLSTVTPERTTSPPTNSSSSGEVFVHPRPRSEQVASTSLSPQGAASAASTTSTATAIQNNSEGAASARLVSASAATSGHTTNSTIASTKPVETAAAAAATTATPSSSCLCSNNNNNHAQQLQSGKASTKGAVLGDERGIMPSPAAPLNQTAAAAATLHFATTQSNSSPQQHNPQRSAVPPLLVAGGNEGDNGGGSTAAIAESASAPPASIQQQQQQQQQQSLQREKNAAAASAASASSASTNDRNSSVAVATAPPAASPSASTSAAASPTPTTPPRRSTAGARRSRMRHEISGAHTRVERANGEHCVTHTPTLDELQKTTFSEYIRNNVLAKAAMYEFNPHLTPQQRRDFYMREPMELIQGIAKVRLPDGFFPSAPYGADRTARGPAWQAGTALGDRPISSPIQQNILGMAGVYEYTHTDLKPCTLAEFRERADRYRLEQLGSVLMDLSSSSSKKKRSSQDDDIKKDGNDGENEEKGGKSGDNDKNGVEEETASVPAAEGDNGKRDNNINSSAAIPEAATPTAAATAEEETSEYDRHRRPGELTKEQIAELERQFWKRLSPTMPPAVYGADEEGTLFGDDPATGWSLAQLDSCLHVLSDIPGVTSPYLYAGMWASVFCAHAEDMNLLSINYLHAGQPKLWYAVAQTDAARFVSLVEHHYSHQLKKCKEFLRHKRCLLSPAILKKAGIRYQTAIQYPGDAIITFPGGFHFGFNAGFNLAEATNFGVPEWVPFGRMAKVCLCRPDSVRIDMDRFVALLQRYERDRQRNKRLTWKAWRQREERRDRTPHPGGIIEETEDEIIEVVSCARKKRKRRKKKRQSEQQRKNEFWIEVKKPVLADGKKAASNKRGNSNNNKRKGKGGASAAARRTVDTWHLAKPIGRKRLELQTRVLCLVPTVKQPKVAPPDDAESNMDEDDSLNEYISSEEETQVDEEECFAGTIVEISEGYVRIHFDGLPKSEDIWMLDNSPKLFLDGGRWEEEREAEGMPPLHYWQEMDSKKRLCT